MDIRLSSNDKTLKSPKNTLIISGSKSESNRLLILQKLFPEIRVNNLSNSEDTLLLQKALNTMERTVDIHHAGTAMRFLTAYFASQPVCEVELTGSLRMKERPIKILVEALKSLGANIEYLEKEGFPPLLIKGKNLEKNKLILDANVSSQYITALLLIAPKLPDGLELKLEGGITSLPYIQMTLALLKQLNIPATFEENTIRVLPAGKDVSEKLRKNEIPFTVESDWSSASYFYSLVALAPVGTEISLSYYFEKSIQGDARVAKIYEQFGVETQFKERSILIKKTERVKPFSIELDLVDTPDIAQTLAVTCLGLGISCRLSGLRTLKIKETDRLQALKNELEKFGVQVSITRECISFDSKNLTRTGERIISIETYNDHRMAMAFAPLALLFPIVIQNARVVEKSYPNFWADFKSLGFEVEKLS
ncbi:MAG: 3-phosphoshikimate 1-carboxyvinyltransferase [Flavobacteriaceae bacterium]